MIRKLLKPLSFLPAILMMYLIFCFSAQDGETSAQLSYKVSYKLVEIGGQILDADFEPWEIEQLAVRFQGPIRKIAHMTEYCVLAICVSFPLYVYGLHGIWLMLVAGIICVGFACTDEYHQAFVAGRGPSKKDVLIDSVGVFAGIILVRIIGWFGRHTIFRSYNRKKHKQEAAAAYADQTNYGAYPPPQGSSVYPPPGTYQAGCSAYPQQGPYAQQAYDNMHGSYGQQPYGNTQGGYGQQSYGSMQGGYGQQPYGNMQGSYGQQSYGNPQDYDDEDDGYVSDQLSEDMSFKKLMRDLKQKKHETE